MPTVLITGGQGDLACAIVAELRPLGLAVLAPSRDELDVARADSVAAFFRHLAKPIDLLINNAGLTRDVLLAKMTDADWQAVLDANLTGAWRCARAVIPGMMAAGAGHILNIASFSGFVGPTGQAHYAAAKAGLIGLTQSLAEELGPHNIRVNALLPGFLETKMTAGLSAAARERARLGHVLGRFNTVADAAAMIGFLHQRLPHVSGQVFQLDSRRRRPGW